MDFNRRPGFTDGALKLLIADDAPRADNIRDNIDPDVVSFRAHNVASLVLYVRGKARRIFLQEGGLSAAPQNAGCGFGSSTPFAPWGGRRCACEPSVQIVEVIDRYLGPDIGTGPGID